MVASLLNVVEQQGNEKAITTHVVWPLLLGFVIRLCQSVTALHVLNPTAPALASPFGFLVAVSGFSR